MMRFRPRYSLLTLLLITATLAGLTALIVGGVKLWHAPRHVVEPVGSNGEKEYTYTRDGKGNRIIHGPMVNRRFEERKLVSFNVMYYRQGKWVDWIYNSEATDLARSIDRSDPSWACPLTAEELCVFHEARDAELQRLLAAGGSAAKQHEGTTVIIVGGMHPRSLKNQQRDAVKDIAPQ